MKTFEQCCLEVAEKNYPNSPDAVAFFMASSALMHPINQQAATLYANEKLKGLLEEVRGLERDYRMNWLADSAIASNRIATRIEELIGENTKPNTP